MAAGIKKGESATAPAQFSQGVLGHWRIASLARTYRFFSADSHFESAPDRWVHRVPKQYRDRAPRRVKLPSGKDIIVEEGCGEGRFAQGERTARGTSDAPEWRSRSRRADLSGRSASLSGFLAIIPEEKTR